jgi:hypothetical protein
MNPPHVQGGAVAGDTRRIETGSGGTSNTRREQTASAQKLLSRNRAGGNSLEETMNTGTKTNSAALPSVLNRYSLVQAPATSRTSGALAVLWGLVACNSLDPAPRPGAGTVRVVPTDTREPVSTPSAAPIMGSSLLRLNAAGAGDVYLVSDADRNVVSFVNNGQVVKVPTGAGTQPNRAVEDAAGFVHVTLRGTGELVMIHPSGEIAARHQVCAAPRGVTLDPSSNELLVACAEGVLLRHTVDPVDYTTVRSIVTEPDVRDVVVQQDRVYVSRFRSAEVLEFQHDILKTRHVLPNVTLTANNVATEREGSRFAPSVAWKMVASPEGDGVVVLHQRALLDQVGAVETTDGDDEGGESSGGSSYGGSSPEFGCSSIVQPAVSEVRADGAVVTSDSISGVVLAVDLVALPDDFNTGLRSLSLASAGPRDIDAPRGTIRSLRGSDDESLDDVGREAVPTSAGGSGVFQGGLQLHGADEALPNGDVQIGCTSMSETFEPEVVNSGGVIGIASNGLGGVAYVQREPAVLKTSFDGTGTPSTILAEDSVRDTGHELFHRDSGGGIACASCHPEATDDGHVWNFDGIGIRKTQFLGVPLSETAPFHWDGSLPNLGSLMDEVFVARMGGVFQSQPRLDGLGTWMGDLNRIGERVTDAEAEARGKALFESKETKCATCHSGPAFTDNQSHQVGTASEKLQTPSLVGLALHPPFMHDGCAKTLHERFNPACGGGDEHGTVSHLNEAQVNDLVAYLTSL